MTARPWNNETAGPRIKELRRQIEQLKARRDDIADSLDRQPNLRPRPRHQHHWFAQRRTRGPERVAAYEHPRSDGRP
jgi:hypothetical protein